MALKQIVKETNAQKLQEEQEPLDNYQKPADWLGYKIEKNVPIIKRRQIGDRKPNNRLYFTIRNMEVDDSFVVETGLDREKYEYKNNNTASAECRRIAKKLGFKLTTYVEIQNNQTEDKSGRIRVWKVKP